MDTNQIINDLRERLARSESELALLKEILRSVTIYECREIGETDWTVCDKDRFNHCSASPEHDTRKRIQSISELRIKAVEDFDYFIDETFPNEGVNFDTYAACLDMFIADLKRAQKP